MGYKTKLICRSHDSILVRCDCGMHFMEIYASDRVYGINWWSYCRHKFPDVQFKDKYEWDNFVNFIKQIAKEGKDCIDVFISDQFINFKNGKVKKNGRLEVFIDDLGYLNFFRYKKHKGKKLIWDLCIDKYQWEQLAQEIEKLNNTQW